MAFRDVSDGVGYNEVLTHLNGMGYRTRLGNLFTKSTLYEMLRNEKYNGIYVFNRASSKNESGRRNNHLSKPVEDMIRIPGGMPRVVDEETFARVQNIMGGRKHVSLNRGSLENYLLTGKLFCDLLRPPVCRQPAIFRAGQEQARDLPLRPPARHRRDPLRKHAPIWRISFSSASGRSSLTRRASRRSFRPTTIPAATSSARRQSICAAFGRT